MGSGVRDDEEGDDYQGVIDKSIYGSGHGQSLVKITPYR